MSSKLLVGAVSGLLATAPFALADDGPVELGSADLDQVTAGSGNDRWPDTTRVVNERTYTSYFAMPISNAVAICYFCSGNAQALAISAASGMARADALALALGQGRTMSEAIAVGPGLLPMPLPSMPPVSADGS